ncbi:MAG: hypothetical protein AAGA10_23305 [Bacteroidota bacterium]
MKFASYSFVITVLFLLLGSPLAAQSIDIDLFNNLSARSIGPAGMSGRVTSIDVVLKQPQIMYVGTASGGLWRSTSGGIDWEPIFDDQPVASIGAVAIDQGNPAIIWAGTGEGNPRNSQALGAGIFKSLDGGDTWMKMGLTETRSIHRVIIHPQNSQIVYVAALGSSWGEGAERGVFRTTDGGKTWDKILYVDEKTGCADLVIDPQNPNKLIAAMWQYRRWPWFFKSGGPGSGMYITHDGGDTWVKRTAEDGLPKGELGRMGLAIAPSNPNKVYALIESEKNAFYASEDGGKHWDKVNDKSEIGNRPFYYYDIYVDPQNENRIYSLYSLISMSEDGGKSFEVIVPYTTVHPDHHAFWIHPHDPHFLIEGNDGGMAISRDRGKSWRFIENLPLAQFYHINTDDLLPYNVYGGMQDNGSWRGPAYMWRRGGIRNAYWEEVFFGDGFDVVPDPKEPERYGYAMSQGGNLGRYDLASGHSKYLKPVHPEGTPLRFNWNAGIAQDPFNEEALYYGSQFLHKSIDNGETWEIISPDLTSNDPEKQKQLESGGLTYDVTNAENYTTIISIAPSPLVEGVLWVGTDDGNLQVTQDSGKTWKNVAANLPGLPKGSWIPQIIPSTYDPSEAFVVANDYRRDNLSPYVFHTKNYGKSWKNIAADKGIPAYCLSFVQDPKEPKLMFLGTEYGLYISFDGANSWQKWTHGFPTVSTMDLKIHPLELDLVIGTFGRAAFVIDDIRPLRQLATHGTAILDSPICVFDAPNAVLAEYRQAKGTRFAAHAMFAGENRREGAMLSYIVSLKNTSTQQEEKEEKVRIEIMDGAGEVIRTFTHKPDSGINRIYWDLDKDGIRYPSQPKPKEKGDKPGGMEVLPGKYLVKMTYKGASDTTSLKVFRDPRVPIKLEEMKALYTMREKELQNIGLVTQAMDELREAQKSLELINQQIPEAAEDSLFQLVRDQGKALKDSIGTLMEAVTGPRDLQGIVRRPDNVQAKIFQAQRYLGDLYRLPNKTHTLVIAEMHAAIDGFLGRVNQFFSEDWANFKETVKNAPISPFQTDFKPLTRE